MDFRKFKSIWVLCLALVLLGTGIFMMLTGNTAPVAAGFTPTPTLPPTPEITPTLPPIPEITPTPTPEPTPVPQITPTPAPQITPTTPPLLPPSGEEQPPTPIFLLGGLLLSILGLLGFALVGLKKRRI